MISTTDSSQSNKEKFKILHKKVVKDHKSKADVKKESDALVARLRLASKERVKKNAEKYAKALVHYEKPEEHDMRIYKALYSTPYDEINRKEKELASLSNQSVIGSSDSSKESILEKFREKKEETLESKKIDSNKKKKMNISTNKNRSKKKVGLLAFHDFLSTTTDEDNHKKNVKQHLPLNSKEKLKPDKKDVLVIKKKEILTSSLNCNPLLKSSDSKTKSKLIVNDLKPVPINLIMFTPTNTIISQKTQSSERDEVKTKSREVKSQNSRLNKSKKSESNSLLTTFMKKVNKKSKLTSIPHIQFTCRNAFTKKIQFKFTHYADSTLDILKGRLKLKYNFIGHLFYKGKELIGDKKKLTELKLPLDCELDIVPKVVSGDYSRQQLSQISRKLDQEKQFIKNIRDLVEGLGGTETGNISIKKAITNFGTMTDSQRKRFDEDMKDKFKKLKEKRSKKRRTTKSFFSKSITTQNNAKLNNKKEKTLTKKNAN